MLRNQTLTYYVSILVTDKKEKYYGRMLIL